MWNGKQCLFGHGELSFWCANIKHPPQVQQIVLLFKERLGIMKHNPSSAEHEADVWAFPAAGLLGSPIPCCQRKQGKPACWRPHLRGIWKPLCLPALWFTGLEKKLPCSEHPRIFWAEMHHQNSLSVLQQALVSQLCSLSLLLCSQVCLPACCCLQGGTQHIKFRLQTQLTRNCKEKLLLGISVLCAAANTARAICEVHKSLTLVVSSHVDYLQ